MSAKKLREEIRQFQKRKKWFAIPLIILGLLLSLPMVPGPGLALVLLGFMLLFPRDGQRLLSWIKARWRRFRGKTSESDPPQKM